MAKYLWRLFFDGSRSIVCSSNASSMPPVVIVSVLALNLTNFGSVMIWIGVFSCCFFLNDVFRWMWQCEGDLEKCFTRCYCFRQVCDVINGDGTNTKIFNLLFSCHPAMGILWASSQTYLSSLIVQLGFVCNLAVFAGAEGSFMTSTDEVSSLHLSIASASIGVFMTWLFFLLFHKCGSRITIMTDARYTWFVCLLMIADFFVSLASLTLQFRNITTGGAYIFPVLKCVLVLNGLYSIFAHRPNQGGRPLLNFFSSYV